MTEITDYKTAYHTLKTNAERLEYSDEVDIDELMDIVETSIAAYKICQARIDAVDAALKDAFAKFEAEDEVN
ncbi:MAG: exodeoxyribonuclease VII small subunit [Moraxella sp.]|nr:exodeoxyribonuclease VII small subunit [Moraxella sp.]